MIGVAPRSCCSLGGLQRYYSSSLPPLSSSSLMSPVGFSAQELPQQLISTSVCSAHRFFFQGGGPPPGEAGNKSKAQHFMKSRAIEMDERLEKKKADHENFYKDKVKPMPLFENAYQPGEFGMRRRLVILHRKEKKKSWGAKERGLAVGEAQTSFLK